MYGRHPTAQTTPVLGQPYHYFCFLTVPSMYSTSVVLVCHYILTIRKELAVKPKLECSQDCSRRLKETQRTPLTPNWYRILLLFCDQGCFSLLCREKVCKTLSINEDNGNDLAIALRYASCLLFSLVEEGHVYRRLARRTPFSFSLFQS